MYRILYKGMNDTKDEWPRMNDTKGHILLVDDHIDAIDYIRSYLEKCGYTVTMATSGQDAVDIAHAKDIDVIFLDIHMPGMTGIETCQSLRDGSHADTPIIFLTADESESSELAGLDAGGNEYLRKPVSAVALEKRVAAYMRRRDRAANLQSAMDDWRRDALTDAMTGARSRRYADRIMQESARDIWVIMCDIDHFKSYNDTFGHEAGDRCLKAVAATLLSHGHDVVRMGGEEFLVLVKVGDGGDVAELIREGVESGVAKPDGEAVTISIGAVHVDSDVELADAIRHADMLLYRSKRNGRNTVTVGNVSDGVPDMPTSGGRRAFRD